MQREQEALGERVLGLFRSAGAEIIAEDLGTVPDFVRGSLARQGVPGFRVLRWERHWHAEGQPFRDPADYPAVSVAASGTHDTEPMMTWWDGASDNERRKVNAIPTVQRVSGGAGVLGAGDARVRDVLLETLFASRVGLAAAAGSGRVRLARPDQRAGDRHRRELDVPPAVADRSPGRCAGGPRAAGDAAALVDPLRATLSWLTRTTSIADLDIERPKSATGQFFAILQGFCDLNILPCQPPRTPPSTPAE